jgi:hypothetical protein
VVCVVRLALLGRGLVHITSKVGVPLFINAHSLILLTLLRLGDPSGG